MNSPHQSPTGFRDLYHALILVCVAPLLFFGIYRLLGESQTGTLEPNPIVAAIKPVAPGEAWLKEIEKLELKLADRTITASNRKAEISGIRQRLAELRLHCETQLHDVPAVENESAIGVVLVEVALEIDALHNTEQTSSVSVNLDQQFDEAYGSSQKEQERQIREAFDQKSSPVIAKHSAQLASLKQANREIEDQIQQLKDQSNRLLLDMEEQLARNARKQAYEPDRAEIQRLLSPFISPAYSQLGEYKHTFQQTAELQPLSYSGLERLGAMEPTIKGLDALGEIGTSPYRYSKNTRPMGAFPICSESTFNNPVQLETVKRAQELLRKHSAHLIEIGLLLP